jgi:hypothetical protein
MTERKLDEGQLNRALLARQLLLERSPLDVLSALERLVGLQAQAPKSPYVGLWTRLDDFDPRELSRALEERQAVRVPLMRSTIHLVSARDCLRLRPVIQPVMDRDLAGSSWGKGVVGVDLEALGEEAHRILLDGPLVAGDLGRALAKRWRKREPGSLAYAARNTLALVQVPPRGLWERSGRPLLQTAETWLGRPVAQRGSRKELIRRYLGAFGPATVADMQTWSGLSGLRSVVETIRSELVAYNDEQGRELFDIAGARLPDSDTPAPVRFLPEFDNLILSHADRSRVIPAEHRKRVLHNLGIKKTFLVDGFVAGEWKLDKKGRRATLSIEPFNRIPKRLRAELEEEGGSLAGFLAPEAEEPGVRFVGS